MPRTRTPLEIASGKLVSAIQLEWGGEAGEPTAAAALRTRFHRLAGSGGSYGFPEMSAVARELERGLDRKRAQLDYLEEPDCFHDLFGHIPMLAHHGFAEMVEHVGHLGEAAIAAGTGDRVARIYWHSVEFGLAMEGGELKILGAGLASSFGEAHFSLESDEVERLPFSVERAIRTAYRSDVFQPLYLVSESLESAVIREVFEE